ncbi:hypothetical protein [Salinicola tamaricis]|uniref:hypothetical protein n=1 Tax=Salinicola tamaricis TaxID=1771309 RepID=UPI00101AE547|nr:hypothetical protein [Salinicola tamaricis]
MHAHQRATTAGSLRLIDAISPSIIPGGYTNNMSLYERFQSRMSAVDKLVNMYRELCSARGILPRGRLDEAHSDLLWLPRSAVAFSLAAMDAYVDEVVTDKLGDYRACISLYVPMKNVLEQSDGTPCSSLCMHRSPTNKERHGARIWVDPSQPSGRTSLSFKSPEELIAAYRLLGHADIIESIAAIWPGPACTPTDIKQKLNVLIQRRNQITYEGDCDPDGHIRQIHPHYATRCKSFIEKVVIRLHRVAYEP